MPNRINNISGEAVEKSNASKVVNKRMEGLESGENFLGETLGVKNEITGMFFLHGNLSFASVISLLPSDPTFCKLYSSTRLPRRSSFFLLSFICSDCSVKKIVLLVFDSHIFKSNYFCVCCKIGNIAYRELSCNLTKDCRNLV